MARTVRTRFAPSPTGYLHIGGVRTALFNWLYAKQQGGQFLLRIDDTDAERNVAEALQPILDGFRWLGINWDEGPEVGGPFEPYYQSQRVAVYQAAAKRLIEVGAAYWDYARTEEIQAEREAAENAKTDFLYSRRWMATTPEQCRAFEAEGRQAVVRLKMPREGNCEFYDHVRGDVSFEWRKEQDHVVQRADGTCLYHLANVVDDEAFQISHVIRAVEHLSNTPRQIFMIKALGYRMPEYVHIPFVAEPGSKTKLSKRKISQYLKSPDFKKIYDHANSVLQRTGKSLPVELFNPVVVDFYREAGYLPDALLNYLLLLGWSLDDKTEDFSREEMIRLFSLERIVKSPASLDTAKLFAFQDRYMQRLPLETKTNFVLPFLQQAKLVSIPLNEREQDRLVKVLQAAGDRIKIAGDILDYPEFFQSDEALQYDEAAFQKRILEDVDAIPRLQKLLSRLELQNEFDAKTLDSVVHQFVQEEQIKMNQIIHALRVSITGKAIGFGMFETMAILGKASCLSRIRSTIARASK